MGTDSTDTAKNVIAINNAGIGFSTTGWRRPFCNDWRIDGVLNANFIKAGVLEAIEFRTIDENFRTKINGGIIQFYDSKTKKIIANILAMRNVDGNITGVNFNQILGYSLALGSSAKKTNHASAVVEIVSESEADDNNTLLSTWRNWEHHDDLHLTGSVKIDGKLECGQLFVGGKKITPGSVDSSGGDWNRQYPPELTTAQEKSAWFIWQFF